MASRVVLLLSGACLLTLGAIANAQSNPLYEHRRSMASGAPAKPFVERSYVLRSDAGLTTLGTPSWRLIEAGVISGDPMLVDVGTLTLRVYVAFRDELDRAASYDADSPSAGPPDPGPFLVIDREDPIQPLVLQTSTGEGSLYLDVRPGSRVTFRTTSGWNPPGRRGDLP